MNNYEAIKNFNIEQMAKFLDDIAVENCDCCIYCNTGCDGTLCLKGKIEWLRTELVFTKEQLEDARSIINNLENK